MRRLAFLTIALLVLASCASITDLSRITGVVRPNDVVMLNQYMDWEVACAGGHNCRNLVLLCVGDEPTGNSREASLAIAASEQVLLIWNVVEDMRYSIALPVKDNVVNLGVASRKQGKEEMMSLTPAVADGFWKSVRKARSCAASSYHEGKA